ncbi:Zn-ribbon domain-containing OB-fold protein [Streptomyces fulvoviolaceus]|uniref:Zn-ribbon domain-containing OB-fold protein n=1 Tax=Streptomyces fulvoviolaceus TaxID=285535 RepID=UPI0006948B34|nr:zinc ribbon domain-containing protein [Streptomyces fulvoviolaceus]MCT9079860.1 zinc ribbon domain-containing protein [Streptomyces fulvoviolaceus]
MLQTDTREHDTEFGEGHEAAATAATTDAPAVRRELLFQRCLWCGTPAYRRSYCRSCGSMTFKRERSEGSGVVVRRNGQTPHNTWFVAMDEGFTLLCQVSGTAPVAVAVGLRVSVVRSVAPLGQGLPVVELTHPAPSLERWR